MLVQQDALVLLRNLPAGSVDCVVTDPPYNMTKKIGGLKTMDEGRTHHTHVANTAPIDIETLTAEFVRVTRGSIYIWCADTQLSHWITALRTHRAITTTRTCVWAKTNPSPMNGGFIYLSAVELCAWGRKAKAPFYGHCKKALWTGPYERVPPFPTPKPVWLFRDLIRDSVPPGGLVLDPFCGSGTTALACLAEGRSWICGDDDASAIALAQSRLDQARVDHAAA